ncbi:PPOX class F420-dependent oxidoreductase [Streptomyces europaeiscabiei]|uniref:PPOX class F420-dependent oxidoreductase n=1 Tax=Streptomyces europaeiscabiei TaxID=146819 RepID=UPI003990C04E
MSVHSSAAWTPPAGYAIESLPVEVRDWLDDHACVTLATVEPDGRPHLSVLWATYDARTVLMATVVGRRKHRNLLKDPRATLLITPRDSGDHYVEVRGTVEILPGGRKLIDDLHEKYRGTRPYPWDGENDERVVLKLHPERILVFHG